MYIFSIKFLFHNLVIITEHECHDQIIEITITHIVIINFYLIVKTFKLNVLSCITILIL